MGVLTNYVKNQNDLKKWLNYKNYKMIQVSILITTKNRLADLKITLAKSKHLMEDNRVEFIVYDDGSTDGTQQFIKENYPNLIFHRNQDSKGYMYNRNFMLNKCKGTYAVSLDDDANFLSENVVENITSYFQDNPKCGVIAYFGGNNCQSLFIQKPNL